jgi:hypothetical protein
MTHWVFFWGLFGNMSYHHQLSEMSRKMVKQRNKNLNYVHLLSVICHFSAVGKEDESQESGLTLLLSYLFCRIYMKYAI